MPANRDTGAAEARLTGDWRELFGVYRNATSIDGSEVADLYRCPDMADVEGFLKSLWVPYNAALEALPTPAPADVSYSQLSAGMYEAVEEAGCRRYTGSVEANAVLASAPAREPDIHVNAERWIAFTEEGQVEGFYLTQNMTVD